MRTPDLETCTGNLVSRRTRLQASRDTMVCSRPPLATDEASDFDSDQLCCFYSREADIHFLNRLRQHPKISSALLRPSSRTQPIQQLVLRTNQSQPRSQGQPAYPGDIRKKPMPRGKRPRPDGLLSCHVFRDEVYITSRGERSRSLFIFVKRNICSIIRWYCIETP